MLNEIEQSFIQRIVEEEEVLNAFKKAIKIEFDNTVPVVTLNDTDEVLGQRTRALDTVRGLLDKVFDNLRQYKGRKKITNQTNLER